MNYYNDNCKKTCAWLAELIAAGEIPDGVVDGRSILDVQPADLAGFVQCHFFAGIGGWPLALKLAGWPEDKSIWTLSAPCQPFSCAGTGKGHGDERHLWPEALRLIRERRPPVIVGEQVPAAIKHGWLDGVFDGLEDCGYACGAVDLPACSVGAPHIRQRLFWLAHSQYGDGWRQQQSREQGENGRARPPGSGGNGGLADASSSRCIGPLGEPESQTRDQARMLVSGEHGEDGGVADSNGSHPRAEREQRGGGFVQQPQDETTCGLEHAASDGREQRRAASGERGTERGCGAGGLVQPDGAGREPREQTAAPARHGSSVEPAGGSYWSDYELIPCADGKARRIESGSAPLVAGSSRGVVPGGDPGVTEAQNSGEARVMRLRGYGNSLTVPAAAQFIKAVMELTEC